jgi:cytochrome P450
MFGCSHRDTFAVVSPRGIGVFLADPELCKEVMVTQWTQFPKPTHFYGLLDLFGRNVVTTEGKEWRRHRKISSPSFSEKNNYMVHDETVSAVKMMFEAWEEDAKKRQGLDVNGGDGFVINTSRDMMHLALTVISAAGFGVGLDWEYESLPKKLPNGHKMSFQHTLEILIGRLNIWLLVPKMVFSLPVKYLAETKTAVEGITYSSNAP